MISKITPNLYIGEYSDVVGQTPEETNSHFKQLKSLGIEHVLSLCSEGVESCQIEKEYKAFREKRKDKTTIRFRHKPIPVSLSSVGRQDSFKVGFQRALKEINVILSRNKKAKILVHCGAGVDRAPFLVAAYLSMNCHLDLADAYRQIKKMRPFVCEHYEWV